MSKMSISTCRKNFNQKYFVLWFNIKFSDNDSQQQHRNGNEKKLGILWIQSWQHRYLVVGYVQSNSIAARIGLKHGDRLGYLNGIVAPKIKHIENFFSDNNNDTCTLRLGILRKHDPIMFNLLQIKSNLLTDNNNNDDAKQSDQKVKNDVNDGIDHSNNKSKENDNNQKNLRYFFVAQSCYENLKEPELYDENILSSAINNKNNNNNNCSYCYSLNSSITSFSPTKQSTPIIDDRSDCSRNKNLQEAGSTFIKNKENYQPIFIDDKNVSKQKQKQQQMNESYSFHCTNKKRPEIQKMLKTYELVSYEKKLYHKYPDTMVKPKIDKHVKSQRVLRNVQKQN